MIFSKLNEKSVREFVFEVNEEDERVHGHGFHTVEYHENWNTLNRPPGHLPEHTHNDYKPAVRAEP